MSAPQCSTQVWLQGAGLPDERRNSPFFWHKGKTNGALRGWKIARFCSYCYQITPGIFVFAFHIRLTEAQRHLLGKNLDSASGDCKRSLDRRNAATALAGTCQEM